MRLLWKAHKPQNTSTPPIFFTKDFLTKLFFKNVWFIGYKVITLHADTGSDLTQLKRTPRNVSTRTETTETNCVLCSLFDFLDKLLTNVKK